MEGIWKARRHSALSFDGVDDYVEVPDSASLDITDEITIEMWMKGWSQNIASNDRFLSKENAYALQYRFTVAPLDVGVYVDGQWRWSGSYQIPSPQNWHHIVGIYSESDRTIKAFVDSLLVASNTLTGLATYKINSSDYNLFLGKLTSSRSGLIASVRIYNRALSEAEVKYLCYNPDDPLDTDHLVLWLHPGSIDTDAGYWWDISGNDNHGQIFGATKVSLVSPEVTVL